MEGAVPAFPPVGGRWHVQAADTQQLIPLLSRVGDQIANRLRKGRNGGRPSTSVVTRSNAASTGASTGADWPSRYGKLGAHFQATSTSSTCSTGSAPYPTALI
jgi:hypothetical protein